MKGNKITLKHPIKFGEEEIAEITFRSKMTVRDMRHLPTSGGIMTLGQVLDLAGNMSDLPEPDMINEVHAEDLSQVLGAVVGFMEGIVPTGVKR